MTSSEATRLRAAIGVLVQRLEDQLLIGRGDAREILSLLEPPGPPIETPGTPPMETKG